MASKWTDMNDVSAGMLADYEVLNNIINNQSWLKNSQVPVYVFKNPSGQQYNSYNEQIRFKTGMFRFNFSTPTKTQKKGFGSTRRPLVFATVHGGGGKVTVSVSKEDKTGATFLLTKTGTGTVKGYVTWLAITTA